MEDEVACSGFFRASAEDTISCLDKFQDGSGIGFIFGNLVEAPIMFLLRFRTLRNG